jgi:hypothetical protein
MGVTVARLRANCFRSHTLVRRASRAKVRKRVYMDQRTVILVFFVSLWRLGAARGERASLRAYLMQFFLPLQHLDELLNLSGSSLSFLRGLYSKQNCVSVCAI